MDSTRWPLCDRFDGKTQPCLCWFGEQQKELAEANAWPGGEAGHLDDWLSMTAEHECNQPYDGTNF